VSETPARSGAVPGGDPNRDFRPVRFLDPSLVRRRPGSPPVKPTWYVADRVIVEGAPPRRFVEGPDGPVDVQSVAALPGDAARPAEELTRIEQVARELRCTLALEATGRRRARRADAGPAPDDCDDDFGFALRLVPDADGEEPNAWDVVERLSGELDLGEEGGCRRVSLDHVMLARPFTSSPFTSSPFTSSPFTSSPFTSSPFTSSPFTSSPFTSSPFTSSPFTSSPFTSSPFTSSPVRGLAEYAVPGWGGRAPVAWLGGRPVRKYADGTTPYVTKDGLRRPVVAVVDTGIGTHPWFGTYDIPEGDEPGRPLDGNGVVIRDAALPDGLPIGTQPVPNFRSEDAEIGGASASPLTGPLDPVAGHGTFVAGIVHQLCPDALLLPVRVVGGDGVGAESDLIRTMSRLLEFHRLGLESSDDRYTPVDVAVLSLGYYHEDAETLCATDALRRVLDELRDLGVVVVAAAGNDGTTRPMFPAALAPHVERSASAGDGTVTATPLRPLAGGPTSGPPVLAVGAQNPDGTTALFSNDGPWVTVTRPGAALVSTLPTTLDGPITSSLRLDNRYGTGHRATIDIEGFQGGFATWSGTSFAAPVLAGEIAAELLDLWAGEADGEAGGPRGKPEPQGNPQGNSKGKPQGKAGGPQGKGSSRPGGRAGNLQDNASAARVDDAWTAVTARTGLALQGGAAGA